MSRLLPFPFRLATGLALVAAGPAIPATTATTVNGPPSGVMTTAFAVGTHPLSFPLIRDEVFAGLVSSNSASNITFSTGDVAGALVAGGKYYLEITNGPLEGDRLDLASASGGVATVNLATTSKSTLTALDADALAGAHVVVRRHVTLQQLAAMFSPTLVGNNNAALADQVLIYQNGALSSYYLRADGVTWREPGKTADQRDYVVAPDASLLVQLRSGAKTWLHVGGVRTNGFRTNLIAGMKAVATGFPVDLSFTEVGAFADAGLPAGVRWVGSNTAANADTFQIYTDALGVFQTYSLLGDGTTWQPSEGTGDVANERRLPGRGMILVKRANADRDYLIIPPYTP